MRHYTNCCHMSYFAMSLLGFPSGSGRLFDDAFPLRHIPQHQSGQRKDPQSVPTSHRGIHALRHSHASAQKGLRFHQRLENILWLRW